MLAELLHLPVTVVRGWQRRGLIRPACTVRRLAYFNFEEVTAARRLAELRSAGVSAQTIEKKLAAIRRVMPGVQRPLAELSVVIEGKELLLRQNDGLVDPLGQLRIDFDAAHNGSSVADDEEAAAQAVLSISRGHVDRSSASPGQMLDWAAQLEEDDQLEAAAEMLRAALAAGGAKPEICFHLAELLYRLGDLPAARERYYMATELDEDYVEARANLGCVLAELGHAELAVAAFQGALVYHADYADVHYHLARALDALDRHDEAESHWRAFLELAADSPWADEATQRVSRAL